MSFLNLSLAEFFAILLPICAAVVAMYLYDRARRRQIVSTLRFFRQARQSPVFSHRKKIQQPWSLLLQLLSLALLLLAIAKPQLSRRVNPARDHVLVLETSAWMNAALPNGSGGPRLTLMQAAQQRAIEYIRAAPASDRIMLVRADQLATPATPFTRDRRELEAAIRASTAGSTALSLSSAIDLARSSQQLSSGQPGEIVIVGSGRAMKEDLERIAAVDTSNLRAILLGGEPNDCGIRKLSARRSLSDPLSWELDVGAYNYGARSRQAGLTLTFAGNRIASKLLFLNPHGAAEATFLFRASSSGLLEASLDSSDDYPADNRAAIELPRLAPLTVQVYSARPELWKPLLTASAFLAPEFRSPEDYTPSGPPHRLVIVDGFTPSEPPAADSIWVAKAQAGGQKVDALRWNQNHPLAAGLYSGDLHLNHASILTAQEADEVIADSDSGPVLIASANGQFKRVVFGFHPMEEGAENHLAVPLLFANLVRWTSPDLFRASEISARPPGLVELETPPGTRREQVQVTSPQIRGLAFTLRANRLRFFAGQAGMVRVTLPDRELDYRLTLPEVGEARWTPPAGTRLGVPPPVSSLPVSRDIWPWLAAAGALGLLIEYILYGSHPILPVSARRASAPAGEGAAAVPENGASSRAAHTAAPQEVRS
jgi:hypothetical protein